MNYINIKNKSYKRSFAQAVAEGPAPNGGLFFPEQIPALSKLFFQKLSQLSLHEIAFEVMKPYVAAEISDTVLHEIVEKVFVFEIPLRNIHDDIFVLELFHGPTLAFKDIGAGFLAQVLQYTRQKQKTKILVATSGDTGGAVANAFWGMENIEVVVLYPKNKVSELQQKQFAGLGKNITALRIDGTFDDCQQLVKMAFADKELNEQITLSSANSINIARWIPQSVYYYWAVAQLNTKLPITACVPSGNLGNLTSAVLAQKTGLAIDQFIAAANQNNIVPDFLHTGIYSPKKSIETVANAMDVGAPNNFIRLTELFDGNVAAMQQKISGKAYSDSEIIKGLAKLYNQTKYLADPHGMTGYLALTELKKTNNVGFFVETASYGKFQETVEAALNQKVELPKALGDIQNRDIRFVDLSTHFDDFKAFLKQH